jgi:hypothetical protein|tara:strand:- start:2420 stop:2821 length:402 start_codon:yes stop_codon:yes gene_type:complete
MASFVLPADYLLFHDASIFTRDGPHLGNGDFLAFSMKLLDNKTHKAANDLLAFLVDPNETIEGLEIAYPPYVGLVIVYQRIQKLLHKLADKAAGKAIDGLSVIACHRHNVTVEERQSNLAPSLKLGIYGALSP